MWKKYDRGGGMVVEAMEIGGKLFSRDDQTLLVMGMNWLEWEEEHEESIPDKLFTDNLLDEYELEDKEEMSRFKEKYAKEAEILGYI